MKKLITLFLLIFTQSLISQTSYLHISNTKLYDFIDELANIGIIDITTAIKPYSREDVAKFLIEAESKKEQLSAARKSQLAVFLKEFDIEIPIKKDILDSIQTDILPYKIQYITPEFTWKDGFFRAKIRPVYGIRYFINTHDNFYSTYGGAEAISYIGKNWSIYMSLRDNYQKTYKLSQPNYFVQEQGGTYKALTGGGDAGGEFSEMRGGITYTWNWGHFAFVKDHIQWGDNLHGSNILSGRTPSFPLIKLHLHPVKWLDFNYFHGWLVSEAIDSTHSIFNQSGYARLVQRTKYIAANMFTVKPLKKLHISFGNSIVYGDMDVQPAYLNPFMFYKSLVHTIHWKASYQNNAMYLNISSRQIKHLHLYTGIYIDEFSIRRVTDKTEHNFISYKGGLSVTDWPVKNIFIGGEYTQTYPITFKHDEPTTSFESNKYNLGHYLKDNSEEYFATIRIHPYKNLRFNASWLYAWHANEYTYIRGRKNPAIDQLPFLKDKTWDNQTWAFKIDYQLFPNLNIFLDYSYSEIKGYDADNNTADYYLNMFSPLYLHGITNTLISGFSWGF